MAPARPDIANALRLLLRASSHARLRLATVASLHTLERLGIVAVAFGVARASHHAVLAATAALAILFALRSALRAALSRQTRAATVNAAVQALLEGSVLADGGTEDLTVTVYDGLHFGQQLADQLPALLGDLAAAPFVAAALAYEAPPRVLAVGALALLVASAGVLVARAWTTPLITATQAALRPIYEDLGHAVSGRLEVVATGREHAFRTGVLDHVAHWQRVATRSEWAIALAGRAPAVAAVLLVGLVVAVDASLRGALEHGAIGAAAISASAVPTFLGLTKGAIDTLRTTVRLRPFFALLDAEPAPTGAPPGTPMPPLPAPIEWRKVSFGYASVDGNQRLALRDASVSWQPGKVLVLHGPNGSGKSTLLRLLLGLARPTSGSIAVGGVDLFDLDLHAWRQGVAYLPQRPYVPERATVREAIHLIVRDATDEQMRASLTRAGLWTALVAHAPADPLDTRAGTLSVGERQRLALARMLCQTSAVILLDEPDANLDADGIALVGRLVRELAQGRMVAVAAHTPELVRQGDTVVELAEGAALRL